MRKKTVLQVEDLERREVFTSLTGMDPVAALGETSLGDIIMLRSQGDTTLGDVVLIQSAGSTDR